MINPALTDNYGNSDLFTNLYNFYEDIFFNKNGSPIEDGVTNAGISMKELQEIVHAKSFYPDRDKLREISNLLETSYIKNILTRKTFFPYYGTCTIFMSDKLGKYVVIPMIRDSKISLVFGVWLSDIRLTLDEVIYGGKAKNMKSFIDSTFNIIAREMKHLPTIFTTYAKDVILCTLLCKNYAIDGVSAESIISTLLNNNLYDTKCSIKDMATVVRKLIPKIYYNGVTGIILHSYYTLMIGK